MVPFAQSSDPASIYNARAMIGRLVSLNINVIILFLKCSRCVFHMACLRQRKESKRAENERKKKTADSGGGEQGWRSGESARLPPMWPGFDSRSRRHMWVEFVVGSRPCSERFFSGYSGFPLLLPPGRFAGAPYHDDVPRDFGPQIAYACFYD